jgi:monoamine oxidase
MQKIVILGAGLTALNLAYQLKKQNIDATLLEARDRIGGRIHTLKMENQAPMELGATWLGKKHTALIALLQELELPIFEQKQGPLAIYESMSTSPPQLVQLPPNPEPTYRIVGGTSTLIEKLAKQLSENQIRLNQVVKEIKFNDHHIQIQTNTSSFEADIVISTLPPNLLVSTINLTPSLPQDILEITRNTHTWMGESIKVGLQFEEAFWQAGNSSGTIFSNVGPINEMYDHSTLENDQHALKGFLNGSFHAVSKEDRKAVVLRQLRKYYGSKVDEHQTYQECVWRAEPYTFAPYQENILPHQFNSHPAYRQSFYDGRFFIAGSETAAQFGGYMDGAVRSANWVIQQLQGG